MSNTADNNMNSKFLPVKILSEEYAERLYQRGQLFLRPLHDFGPWSFSDKPDELNNNYRGDPFSGLTEIYTTPEESSILTKLPNSVKSHIVHPCLIDGGDAQYFKIYSMTCLEYENDSFLPIDKDMAEFGAKAVVIKNFNAFLYMVNSKLEELSFPYVMMCDRMRFYDYSHSNSVNPIFDKDPGQAYQKEIRIAIGKLEHSILERKPIQKELSNLCFEIGPVKYIADIVDVEDLINGNYTPEGYTWFDDDNSYYNRIRKETQRLMAGYTTEFVKSRFSLK